MSFSVKDPLDIRFFQIVNLDSSSIRKDFIISSISETALIVTPVMGFSVII